MNRCRLLTSALCASALLTTGAIADNHDDAERAQIQQQLNETRSQIQQLTERLAELSFELAEEPLHQIHHGFASSHGTVSRAAIGATIQRSSQERGARVLAVTPDGPADRAGIRTGDIIVGMNDLRFDGEGVSAVMQVTEFMADIEPGDEIAVALERDGQPLNLTLQAQALDEHDVMAFSFDTDSSFAPFSMFGDGGHSITLDGDGEFEFFFSSGPWSDMEVVALTPALGDYFGVSEGLLVVRAPSDDKLDLREGDVIVRVDGATLDDRSELNRSLAKRARDETVRFDIIRQRQSMSVAALVPRDSVHSGDKVKRLIKRFRTERE